MRHRTIVAISAAALLALAGCTDGGDPPSGEPNTQSPSVPTAVGSESAEPTDSASTDPDPTTDPTETVPEPTDPDPTTDPTETVPEPTDPDERALLDLVRAEGTVSVIVEAALVGEAERGSPEHDRLVTEAQDALEAELDPEHTSITRRFEKSARLTLTVDEEGLRALFASPRVTHVWENATVSTH